VKLHQTVTATDSITTSTTALQRQMQINQTTIQTVKVMLVTLMMTMMVLQTPQTPFHMTLPSL
jgi:hypothetical protein